MHGIFAIDLFAGAGGLSIGAVAAGVNVCAQVDSDPDCCESLRVNKRWHRGRVIEADITTIPGATLRRLAGVRRSDPLMIIGGAPCQPFSKAAYWIEAGAEAAYRRARARGISIDRPAPPSHARPDPRRDLIAEYWRLVLETRADAFVFENVPSILHPRNRHLAHALIAAATREGFNTVLIRANAVEYGVAQRRERVFILGARAGLPVRPATTHAIDHGSPDGLLPAVTAKQAIRAFAGREYAEPEEIVRGRWAEHLRTVPPGWNYKAHTAWGGHPNPTFETETRFWSFLLKLHPDRPSWTVPANPGPWVGPFHWRSRRLRTPELAAIQGFPAGYRFAGNRRSQVRQIGNAVPPPLGRRMIEATVAAMTGRKAVRT
jgi:DNA (cytosine-5)-methyltransferase 1